MLTAHARVARDRIFATKDGAANVNPAGGVEGDQKSLPAAQKQESSLPHVAPPERVQVVCRARPVEEYSKSSLLISAGEGGDLLSLEGSQRQFTASRAFDETSTQDEVFDQVGRPSLQYVLKGYGACIFAYGQTGSGKTFTMSGTPSQPGLIPRIVGHLFRALASDYQDFTVSCQYVEIYMEKVRDLFNPSLARNPWDSSTKINVRFDGKKAQMDGVKRVSFSRSMLGENSTAQGTAHDAEEQGAALASRVLRDVESASRHRVVRGHALNAESSRSHSVLLMEVTARQMGQDVASTLMLVDLAGSENIGKAQVEGLGKDEARSINKSLFSLTRCIEALAGGHKVPLRESMLTKILAPVLNGQACCTLIAALRGEHPAETRETLKFTETALKVKVQPKQTSSEALGAVQERAQDLRNELQTLRQELEWLRKNAGGQSGCGGSSGALETMLKEKESIAAAKAHELAALQNEIGEAEHQLASVRRELDSSKREAERERDARQRAEAENCLLRAQLQQAKEVRQGDALTSATGSPTRGSFDHRTELLLEELSKALQELRVEEALKLLVVLVRHFQQELTNRRAEAHTVQLALLGDYEQLLEILEGCSREWSELNLQLCDWGFMLSAIDAQSQAISELSEVHVGPGSPKSGSVADLELGRFATILAELQRLSSRVHKLLLGQSCSTACGEVAHRLDDAGSPTSPVSIHSPAASSPQGASLAVKVLNVAFRLSSSSLAWQRHADLWTVHWQPRFLGKDPGSPAQRLQAWEHPRDSSRFQLDLDNIVCVSSKLDAVLSLVCNQIADTLGLSETGGRVLEVQRRMVAAFSRFLNLADTMVGEHGFGERGRRVIQELPKLQEATERESLPLSAVGPVLESAKQHWQHLQEGFDQNSKVTPSVVQCLRLVQADRLCDEPQLEKHLESPSTAFITDAVKFALCKLGISLDANPSDDRSDIFDRIQNRVAMACKGKSATFFKTLCEQGLVKHGLAVSGSELSEGWEQRRCVWIGRLALAAAALLAEESERKHGLQPPVLAICREASGLKSLCQHVCQEIGEAIGARQTGSRRKMLDAAQDAASLRGHVEALLLEHGRYCEDREAWEQERFRLQEELQQLRVALVEEKAATARTVAQKDAELRHFSEIAEKAATECRDWRCRAEASDEQVESLRRELAFSSVPAMLSEDLLEMMAEQEKVLDGVLDVIEDIRDRSIVLDAGAAMSDMLEGFTNLVSSQLDTLQHLTDEAGSPTSAQEPGLAEIGGYISRSQRRLRAAQAYAQETHGDCLAFGGSTVHQGADDEDLPEICKTLKAALLSLAEQQAAVGSVRLDEERSLMAYFRAAVRREKAKRLQLAQRCSELEARLAAGEGHEEEPLSPAAEPSMQEDSSAVLSEVERGSSEFRHISRLVERSVSGSSPLGVSVNRVQRIFNHSLLEAFQTALQEQAGPSSTVSPTFFAATNRICQLVAEAGFCTPAELGGGQSSPLQLSTCVSGSMPIDRAGGGLDAAVGRIRTLLVCDLAPGASMPTGHPELVFNSNGLPETSLSQLRQVDSGYDSVLLPRQEDDLFCAYDPRSALPRYLVQFDVLGLGKEDELDGLEVERLKVELEQLRNGSVDKDGSSELCRRLRELQRMHTLEAESWSQKHLPPCRFEVVSRRSEPNVWQRCAARLAHAIDEGPGLTPGLEAVLTKLERIVNPGVAARFYGAAAELFYVEEHFRWMLHNGTTQPHLIGELGFSSEPFDSDQALSGGTGGVSEGRFGKGFYFGCSASLLGRTGLGQQHLLLCEVAIGRSMLAQTARRNLDGESLKRAGFDCLHAPRAVGDEIGVDEWVVYNHDQARPAFLLTFEVQPRAVAAELLNQLVQLEEQRRSLDEQLAGALQEVEDARREAEETRSQLDAQLAQQLEDQDRNLYKAEERSRAERERLDLEQAKHLQTLETVEKRAP